jgi:hypothetical protein
MESGKRGSMGSAARGVFAVAVIALLGLAGGASAQVVPIPIPPPPPPPDLPDLPIPPVPPVPSPGPNPTDPPPVGSPATPSTATSGASGGGGSGGGSTASGSGKGEKTGSRAARARTRFDRLPHRLEALLERIAAGRQVRADLRRLERLLASLSPRMRARILRLVRTEIAHLRGGNVTPAERRRIQRLQMVIGILKRGGSGSTGGPPLEAVQPSATTIGEARGATGSIAPATSSSSPTQPFASRGSLATREGGSGRESDRSILGLPASRWEIPLGVFIAFALLFVLSLGALVLAVAPPRTLPAGRLREMMKLQRAEVGFTGATTLAGLTLLLALTLFLGAPL